MRFLTFILLFVTAFAAEAREWEVAWDASARVGGTTGRYMPFWARTGESGILPMSSSGLVTAGLDAVFDYQDGWSLECGANVAGALSRRSPFNSGIAYALVDRLYLTGNWKMLHLDVGMRPLQKELGDLSVTGGNVICSGNARNIPGINFRTDWIYLEKKQRVGIKVNFAHYQFIDRRFMERPMLHNKSIALKAALGSSVDLVIGFDHWALWGGISPVNGPQPSSFIDYMRILAGRRGDEDATKSDQVNALGNHLGRETVRLDWRASGFLMTFQYDKPFEDNSGVKFKNFPDGVWSLKFSLNDRNAFVTDIIYEFINTTWQSGPLHDRPATEEEMALQDPESYWYGRVMLGGRDDYFSHSEYASGWTNYGRIIGLPLIVPSVPDADGIVLGPVSNRLRAHHVGLSGNLADNLPYMLKATFSRNFGRYVQSMDSCPWQMSLAFTIDLDRKLTGLPVSFEAGLYGDIGELYQNTAGLTFRVRYQSSRSSRQRQAFLR